MSRASRRLALATLALAVVSCNENLPVGPNTFAANLSIISTHDTVVVGDLNPLTAQTKDDQGRVIAGLTYAWSTNTLAVGDLVPVTGDTTGQSVNVRGRHTGITIIGLSLTDPRFTTTAVTRPQTVVVAGVRASSTHDSTLTAVNDTATAIAMGLIHSNGASVPSPGQTVQWTHLGSHASAYSPNGAANLASDTIKYVAKTNGVDTLIAGDQFCLAGAKCADTVIVRVSQQLTLTLSAKTFNAWSFNDSVGPTVRLADRRGNGLIGTSIRLIPVTPADAAIVGVSLPVGTTNSATGQIASPLLIAKANGTARVAVNGIGPDGVSVVASDTIFATVRQVARRVAVEAQRANVTANDSILIKPLARDARGFLINDATLTMTANNIVLNFLDTGNWAGPNPFTGTSMLGVVSPVLTGVAVPGNNPLAPQIAPFIDLSQITVVQNDTATAGSTSRTFAIPVVDSLARPAAGQWVRFGTSFGTAPDSVQVDALGFANVTWAVGDSAMLHTLTGVRGMPGGGPFTYADSAGRIVFRHSVLVVPSVPHVLKSTVEVSNQTVAAGGTITVTVTVRDQYNNLVPNAQPTDFVPTTEPGGGTIGPFTCTFGVCTATYTAPAVAGTDLIHIRIQSAEILLSPVTITIT